MIRILLSVLTFISLFLFPYPFTAALSFAASLSFPWLALVVGFLAELLYYAGSETYRPLPLALITGAVLSLAALFVRRFVRERIMG